MTNKLSWTLTIVGDVLLITSIISILYFDSYWWYFFITGLIISITGAVLYQEPKGVLDTEKPKVVILDNNELSISSYLEEHPEIADKMEEKE